jgi:hypothetical protein
MLCSIVWDMPAATGVLAELIARLHGQNESPHACFMVVCFAYLQFFALTL